MTTTPPFKASTPSYGLPQAESTLYVASLPSVPRVQDLVTLRRASMACARASSCAWVRWLIKTGMISALSRKELLCLVTPAEKGKSA